MIFSEVERLGSGGGSERHQLGRFHALECFGGVAEGAASGHQVEN